MAKDKIKTATSKESFLSKWEPIIKDMLLQKRHERKPKECDVYAKLRRAYDENRGTNLTADEVFDLVRGNDAVWPTCYQEDDAQSPEAASAEEGK